MIKILVTGGSGQVGQELQKLSWPDGMVVFAPPRDVLDLSQPAHIEQVLRKHQIVGIVNAGAYTSVDAAESDGLNAFLINGASPTALAMFAKEYEIPLVHISTDYVFNGLKDIPYNENDPVEPQNVYGASKAAGEFGILTSSCRHVILRTSWVFSETGKNFVKTMIKLADRPELTVVDDQVGCPTSAKDIAETSKFVLLRMLQDQRAPMGIHHFCGDEQVTWFGFAQEIFKILDQMGYDAPRLIPVTSSAYPTSAKRPQNSAMSVEKISHDFDLPPSRWRSELRRVVGNLVEDANIGERK